MFHVCFLSFFKEVHDAKIENIFHAEKTISEKEIPTLQSDLILKALKLKKEFWKYVSIEKNRCIEKYIAAFFLGLD